MYGRYGGTEVPGSSWKRHDGFSGSATPKTRCWVAQASKQASKQAIRSTLYSTEYRGICIYNTLRMEYLFSLMSHIFNQIYEALHAIYKHMLVHTASNYHRSHAHYAGSLTVEMPTVKLVPCNSITYPGGFCNPSVNDPCVPPILYSFSCTISAEHSGWAFVTAEDLLPRIVQLSCDLEGWNPAACQDRVPPVPLQ